MVNFTDRKIVVTIEGERDDYAGFIKALLFMLGNQNPETPPDSGTLFTVASLLNSLMLEPEQVIKQ